MALSANYLTKIVTTTASITDVIAFHEELRLLESSADGILYAPIHTYKLVPLGGGANFPAVAFINGWQLQFPAGNWEIRGGNVDVTIVSLAGVFVKQTQSAAYAVTAGGSGGSSAEDIAIAVRNKLPEVGLIPAML